MATDDKDDLLPRFQQAKFLISAQHIGQCPEDSGREIAFAGRSNAGKSSAINAICHQNSLARTSKTPGRTQLLNFFTLEEPSHRIVDLPGYGYAQVPLKVKQQWQRHLTEYLNKRHSLAGLVLVMDIRHPMSDFDQQMISLGQASHLPTHILLTKEDKLKYAAKQKTLHSVVSRIQQLFPDLTSEITLQSFSALKKTGISDARKQLWQWLTDNTSDELTSEGTDI